MKGFDSMSNKPNDGFKVKLVIRNMKDIQEQISLIEELLNKVRQEADCLYSYLDIIAVPYDELDKPQADD